MCQTNCKLTIVSLTDYRSIRIECIQEASRWPDLPQFILGLRVKIFLVSIKGHLSHFAQTQLVFDLICDVIVMLQHLTVG